MVSVLINWIVSAMVIFSIAYIIPGVKVSDFTSALVVALVLGIPINILTLGIFTFVLNALLILLVSNIVAGFKVDGFFAALIFAIVLSITNTVIHNFLP